MKNNYLLVDIGNTNIKYGIYDRLSNKLNRITSIKRNQPITILTNSFKSLKHLNPTKIFISSTRPYVETNKLSKMLVKLFDAKVKIIGSKDFDKSIKVVNKENVAPDLLLLMFWAAKNFKKSAVVCLGTVYSVVYINNKQCKSVLLIPSISKAINEIPNHSCISANHLPSIYNKNTGLNTKDCFAAGANLMLEGLVDNIVKTYNICNNNIVITGGDAYMYQNINKKYKVINELTIKALALLVKEKCW